MNISTVQELMSAVNTPIDYDVELDEVEFYLLNLGRVEEQPKWRI